LTQQQKGEKNKSDCKIKAYRLAGLDLKENGIEQEDSVRRAQEMTFRKQHRGKAKTASNLNRSVRQEQSRTGDYQSTPKINQKNQQLTRSRIDFSIKIQHDSDNHRVHRPPFLPHLIKIKIGSLLL
jgi:hypothetical protein